MYVYDQAHVLAKAIRETEEYKSLKRQKEKIDGDPALAKMFTQYRNQQFYIQKLQFMGQQVPEETAKKFGQMHDIVIANQVLKTFLEAEQRFGVIMTDIQKILVDGLDLQ